MVKGFKFGLGFAVAAVIVLGAAQWLADYPTSDFRCKSMPERCE